MVLYKDLSKKDQMLFDKKWNKMEKLYCNNRNKSDDWLIKRIAKMKFKNKPFGKKKATIYLLAIVESNI